MNKVQTIYFVTSNQKKYESLRSSLESIGILLERLEADFNEGRSLCIESITKEKLTQAKKIYPGKKIVVDDRGFFIPSLNGFPGPFVKVLLDGIGVDRLAKLMKDESDKRARFSYGVGYYDGKKDHIFTADEEGFIVDEPRGDNLHGWTELLYVYGYKTFPKKSLAELDDNEWQEYLDDIENIDIFKILCDYIQKIDVV